jgi:hypothetical protein
MAVRLVRIVVPVVRVVMRRARLGVVVRAMMRMDVLECAVPVAIAAERLVERVARHPARG